MKILVVWIRLEDTNNGVRPVAFFPSEPATMDPTMMMSYSTIGQHGAASEEYVRDATRECEGVLKVKADQTHTPLRGVIRLAGAGGGQSYLQETATMRERIAYLCRELSQIYETGEDKWHLSIHYPSDQFVRETLPLAKLARKMALKEMRDGSD